MKTAASLRKSYRYSLRAGRRLEYNIGDMRISEPCIPTAVAAAVEALPFGVAITDSHGSITSANAAFAQGTGYSPDELIGQSAGDFPWDDLANAPPSSEPWLRKTGESCAITALRNPAGEVTGFWVTRQETAGLQRNGDAPHPAESSLAALIESTDDLIWSVDLDYRLLTFNRAEHDAFERSYGVQMAVGMLPEDLLPPERAAVFPPLFERALSEGPFRAEYVMKDGRTLEMAFNPIVQHGKKTGISVFGKDITERKRAQEALREAEAKYRSIFERALEGMFRSSADGRILDANPALARMLGYDSARDLISTITDAAHQLWFYPGDRLKVQEIVEANGLVRAWEYQLKRKDGSAIWASISGRKVCGADGRMLFYEGFVQDITERKAAEQALRESEAKYRGRFEGALDGIYRASPPGRTLDANPAMARILGYDSAQELVSTITDSAHQLWLDPTDRLKFREVLEAGGFVRGWECQFRRKDGSAIWVLLNAWRVCGADGRTLCYEGSIQDITERKRAEDALRNSAERRWTILHTAMDGFWVADAAGSLLEVNETYCRMSGYSEAELLAIGVPGVVAGETAGYVAAHLQRIMARGEDRFESRHRRKDGSVFDVEVSVQYRPLDGGQLVGFVRDITAAKRAREEREKLQLELAQAQKMESIGRLAGGVAHDFNNLLTVINGYSRLLLARLGADDPARAQIAEIHKAGERAAELTRQMLAFSRKQVLEPRVLDVNGAVKEMRSMLERLMGEDVEVHVVPGAVGGTVRADPHQLGQAILNLAVNARDAMPGGGRLLIETACVERGESHAGRYVMLAVSDTGSGMDEATRQRIFEPFFTTKEAGKGTGLGLPAVQGVVEQSGGFIEVDSEPGRGTAFRIYLPRVEGAAFDSGQSDAVGSLHGKETVLVVEDLAGVREFVVAALRTYGYHAIAAEDAGQALLLCEREGGRIDLVLTDVVMPKVSGRELARRLRERWPAIKVLFMSGYDDAPVEDAAGEFIHKPFSTDRLAAKVREVLRSPHRPARILVADDEAEVRGFLRTALEGGGYEVIEAANGKQALIEARAGGVDLVITDLVMPEQEGLETIVALRKEAPSVGIVAISGAFGGQYLGMAGALGAQAVLSKPVSAELLLAKVAQALQGRR
jgi:hypothetical protein